MGILVECPKCKTRNSIKTDKCKCGVHLKKQGHKNYWIDYYDDTGKRNRERIGPSKSAAEQRLREVLKARTEERHIDWDLTARVSLGDLFKWYLSLPEVKAKAAPERDISSIKTLVRLLGEGTRVRELTLGKVESYRQQRLGESSPSRLGQKIAVATVNKDIACLKTVLNRAVRHGKIDHNPIRDIRKLPENNVRMPILPQEEFERLVYACPQYLRPVVILAYYTGMRKNEIVLLTWDEVDLTKDFIRLRAERTKTNQARSVPLHPRVKSVLSSIPRAPDTNRVFLKAGKPLANFKYAYSTACRKCGLSNLTFHDLRHCAINNLRLAGNDYFKIMAMSGHKTVSVFKRYNLVTEEELSTILWDKQSGMA